MEASGKIYAHPHYPRERTAVSLNTRVRGFLELAWTFHKKIKISYPCRNLSLYVDVTICQTIRCHFFPEDSIFRIHRRDGTKCNNIIIFCKPKGKVHPRTGHEGPDGE